MHATLPSVRSYQLVLNNNREYIYTVRMVEIDNILSTAVVALQEYAVVDMAGNNFRLYKTQGGNWYDIPEVNANADAGLLALLKAGIDLKSRIAE